MGRVKAFFMAAAVVPAFVACGIDTGEDNQDPNSNSGPVVVDVSGNVTTNTTWVEGLYTVPREFRVRANLEIEPCTTVRVSDRFWVDEGGSIIARGTEECPIVFTSTATNPQPGDWRFIEISQSAGNDSVFEHVVFEYGAAPTGSSSNGGVDLSARASFHEVLFREMEGTAIRVRDEGRLDRFESIAFEAIGDYPIQVPLNEVAAIDGITTNDVTNNVIRIRGGAMTRPGTWTAQSIPFEFSGNFNGDYTSNSRLEIGAGSRVLLEPAFRFFIREGASIHITGTEEAPVVFESRRSSPQAGDWMSIVLESAAEASSISWATFRHGGSTRSGAITADAPLTLNNVTFEQNQHCDVGGDQSQVTATDSTFEPCL